MNMSIGDYFINVAAKRVNWLATPSISTALEYKAALEELKRVLDDELSDLPYSVR